MTIEVAFQADTNMVTLSSATWLLGEEFVRRVDMLSALYVHAGD